MDLFEGLKDHSGSVDFSKVVLLFANYKCVAPSDAKSNLSKAKSKFADAAGITKYTRYVLVWSTRKILLL